MKKRNYLVGILFVMLTAATAGVRAQDPAGQDMGGNAAQRQGGRWGEGQNGPRPLFGKITSIGAGTLVITGRDGQTVTVKLTEQTEFRKEREKAAITDFKVGDMVMVRGDENAEHTVTANLVGTRSGGPGGPGGMQLGTLGKDYVAGEVKSVDAPKITVLRTDNVTQTLELNEETSLRRGRESITMADIQVGDHIMARGAVQNDVFVPKGVMVMKAEQWKRMQDTMGQNGPAKPSGDVAAPPKPQD